MNLRTVMIAAAAAQAFALTPVAALARQAVAEPLRARDINGFALGMPRAQVLERCDSHEDFGPEQSICRVDDLTYEFGFTVRGRLFSIESVQPLGPFWPDQQFTFRLTSQLTDKFGAPHANHLPEGPATWRYSETYSDASGMRLKRDTVSLSVMVTGDYGEAIALDLKLMDFRLASDDAAAMNAARAQDMSEAPVL